MEFEMSYGYSEEEMLKFVLETKVDQLNESIAAALKKNGHVMSEPIHVSLDGYADWALKHKAKPLQIHLRTYYAVTRRIVDYCRSKIIGGTEADFARRVSYMEGEAATNYQWKIQRQARKTANLIINDIDWTLCPGYPTDIHKDDREVIKGTIKLSPPISAINST